MTSAQKSEDQGTSRDRTTEAQKQERTQCGTLFETWMGLGEVRRHADYFDGFLEDVNLSCVSDAWPTQNCEGREPSVG